ncbi:MAG: RNA polymerase sigma factor [Acidobacteriota bacterium]
MTKGLDEEGDWELLARSADDASAFGELFRRHRDYVYRVCCGLLGRADAAEDATHEVFLRVVARHSTLTESARLRTLLYGFALNVVREGWRRGAREVSLSEEHVERLTAPAVTTELRSDLFRLLPSLPERQREVLVLRLIEGLATREVAEVLGCSEGTVKTHLHRATRSLRRKLQEDRRRA